MKLYRNNCLGCHGGSVRKSVWGTTSFYPRVPQFGFDPLTRTDSQIFEIVKRGVRYTGMAAWSELMSDGEIWDVSAFLGRLDSLPDPVAFVIELRSGHRLQSGRTYGERVRRALSNPF